MCTVTFVPRSSDGFVLTSNRDEAPQRNTLPPQSYNHGGVRLLFPKDAIAGGTWIGTSERNRLICLLNGGFEPHERMDSYRMSRGIIVTDLLTQEDATGAIRNFDFTNIEPFTIVMVDWNEDVQLFELVWDGSSSHFEEKPLMPHIWSSSLLYPKEIKRKREVWFSDFLFDSMSPSEEELLHFHKNAGEGDPQWDLIMDRGFVKTKSISQFSKDEIQSVFRYEDLQTQEITTLTL
ncbi:MAG: NRDE family protein [Bacteroidota bacterium]